MALLPPDRPTARTIRPHPALCLLTGIVPVFGPGLPRRLALRVIV